MEDKDFRVGDAVCSLAHGDGVIKLASKESGDVFPYSVSFASGWTEWYMRDGRAHMTDSHPTLFHGTFKQVFGQVKDVNPGRMVTKYLNAFHDLDSKPIWVSFDTEESARRHAITWYSLNFVAIAVPIEVEE